MEISAFLAQFTTTALAINTRNLDAMLSSDIHTREATVYDATGFF